MKKHRFNKQLKKGSKMADKALRREIMTFLILDMGKPTMRDFKKFLDDCKGVML